MVLLSIVSRQVGFNVPGVDAYAGYMMAAAGFLALAHTLEARRAHPRHAAALGAARRRRGAASRSGRSRAASLLAALFAVYSCKLAWQSYTFHDISTSNDATPLWLPELSMALGSVVFAIAFVDELVLEIRGRRFVPVSDEATRNEWTSRSPRCSSLSLFAILASGVWIGLTLSGVAWIGMQLFSSRPAGDAMAVTIWGSSSSWTLTALPLFIWMGEILFRTRLSEDMFRGLAPWMQRLPGRLLHTNVVGCAIFAAVSGSSAATCATIGKMSLPELARRGYPDMMSLGSLAGAGTLGLLIPPSIIMIVYGVTADVSISQLFIGGVIPGIVLAGIFSLYIAGWSIKNADLIPPPTRR